jgi:hypothetical protein
MKVMYGPNLRLPGFCPAVGVPIGRDLRGNPDNPAYWLSLFGIGQGGINLLCRRIYPGYLSINRTSFLSRFNASHIALFPSFSLALIFKVCSVEEDRSLVSLADTGGIP